MILIKNTLKKKPLTNLSDTLISSDKEFFDLDGFKETERRFKKFKSCDGLQIKTNKIILMEFKRCNLFYKEDLSKKESEIVEQIIKETPEKIVDTLLVLLPECIEDYRENPNYKTNILIILGSDTSLEKDIYRARQALNMKRPQLEKLESCLNKYSSTSYVNNIKVITKEMFIKRCKI